MAALDLVEHKEWSAERVVEELRRTRGRPSGRPHKPAHDGLIAWTEAALANYLAARADDQRARPDRPTHPVELTWVARWEQGGVYYEQTCWGRRYSSEDGRLREIWLLAPSGHREQRPAAELAAAAYALAYGDPCENAFRERHKPARGLPDSALRAPETVRVVAVGCGTGTFGELLEWEREEARRRYREDSGPVLTKAVAGIERVPGGDCAGCKLLATCDAVHHASLLPHIARAATPRRTVSVSDLRAYDDCPAQYHLTRQLNLRSTSVGENEHIRRGRAVDAWLNDRHRRRPARRCRTGDVPPDHVNWSAGGFELVGETAALGARMLAQHTAVCPLTESAQPEQVQSQRLVAVHDPDLELVFLATPDLLYTRSGGWVWRETKTALTPLWEGRPLLRQYPQIALAVVLFAAGVFGDPAGSSRVELEVLNPDDCALEEIDPRQDTVLAEARAVIGDYLTGWLRDETFTATPGRACAGCAALDWCEPGRAHVAEEKGK